MPRSVYQMAKLNCLCMYAAASLIICSCRVDNRLFVMQCIYLISSLYTNSNDFAQKKFLRNAVKYETKCKCVRCETLCRENASAHRRSHVEKMRARVVVKPYTEKIQARAKKNWHAFLSNFSTLRPSDENSRRRLSHQLVQHLMHLSSQLHCIFAAPPGFGRIINQLTGTSVLQPTSSLVKFIHVHQSVHSQHH